MKYMGSKREMLKNGLGVLINEQASTARRIIDPFCGSGAVAWYAAQHTNTQVIATDLQHCAVARASAVLSRTAALDAETVAARWFARAQKVIGECPSYDSVVRHERGDWGADPSGTVARARDLCTEWLPNRPLWSAYGGHYFSPRQALSLDALRATLPPDDLSGPAALAALISAASVCAASPGHTAQPFQPTPNASGYLFEAWRKDPFYYCKLALQQICPQYARTAGLAYVADAASVAYTVDENDLLILDPPYSGVQYSRFYHVLETVARGTCGMVDGIGRYPPIDERPQSLFSLKTRSATAVFVLLRTLSLRRASIILTFPAGQSSNGLTGDQVIRLANRFFRVEKKIVKTRFSTLGGNGTKDHRPARHVSPELILLLRPRPKYIIRPKLAKTSL